MKLFRFLMPRFSALMVCCMMVVIGPLMPLEVMGMSYSALPASAQPAAQIYMDADSNDYPMGVLPEGTPVTVLGIEGSRYRIDCYDHDGYIGRNLVEWDSKQGCYMVRCADEPEEAVSLETRNIFQMDQLREDLLTLAQDLQGVPYVYGGTSDYGFDCSGFVYYIYQQMGWDIGRSARPQLAQSVIVDPADLQPCDLVFFCNTDGSDDYITHVGMYIGDGKFIHSGSNTGVAVRDMTTGYYAENFRCARRLLVSSITKLAPRMSLEMN